MTPALRRWTRAALASAAVSSSMVLASCETPHKETAEMKEMPAASTAAAPVQTAATPDVAARIMPENGRIMPDASAGTGPLIRQRSSASIVGRPALQPQISENGDVTLNYVDTDIREIVRIVLGDILKINYTIEPGFQGVVTAHTSRPLKHDELLQTLQGLLAQVGGTMTYDNGIFHVGSAGNDSSIPPLVDGTNVAAGTQIVPLRYASAKQLAAMLEPYVGDGAKILTDPTRNVLAVSGTATARQNIVNLIKVFDVDYLAGQSYALFPVKSGEPSKLAANLQAALQLDPDGAMAGSLKIVAIDEANAVMVIASQPSYLDRAGALIAQLDQVKETAGRHLHVYYLKNAQATDLQPVLQRAVNPPSGGGGDIGPGSLPPTAEPAQVAAAAAAPAGGTVSPIGNAISGSAQSSFGSQAGAAPAQAGTASTSTSATPQQVSGGAAKGPQIIADAKSNSLIIVATESEYANIEPALRKLDVLPLQVLVEVTVAEVTLNNSLSYGTQFFFSHGPTQATLSNSTANNAGNSSSSTTVTNVTNSELFSGLLLPNFPGLAIARTAGAIQYAIEALKSVTNVRVISSPKLLILDKQRARLEVGDLVPIITQSATSVVTSSAAIVNNVQYQQTGVILDVTPKINSGGLVTLDIDQEVSQVVNTTSSTIDSPTFQQRKFESKVVVQSGETISLAGLITDTKQKGNSGIPFLQDIPLLGALFSTRNDSDNRQELLVLITPRVVYDQRDARALTEELRRKLAPSALTQ